MTQQEKESKLAALEKAIETLRHTPVDTPEQLIERLQKQVADLEAENLRLRSYKRHNDYNPITPASWPPYLPHKPLIYCSAQ